jgi:hypothetical protein
VIVSASIRGLSSALTRYEAGFAGSQFGDIAKAGGTMVGSDAKPPRGQPPPSRSPPHEGGIYELQGAGCQEFPVHRLQRGAELHIHRRPVAPAGPGLPHRRNAGRAPHGAFDGEQTRLVKTGYEDLRSQFIGAARIGVPNRDSSQKCTACVRRLDSHTPMQFRIGQTSIGLVPDEARRDQSDAVRNLAPQPEAHRRRQRCRHP